MNYFGNFSANITEAPVLEGYCPEVGNVAMSHAEFMEDMVAVFESMHEMEMNAIELRKEHGGVALESIGADYLESHDLVAEASVKDIFAKIKDAIMKLWGKIKGFFKNLRKYFDYMIKDGKEFAKKYQTEIRNAAVNLDSDFEVKVYKYTNLEDTTDVYDIAKGHVEGVFGVVQRKTTSQLKADVEKLTEDHIEKNIYENFRNSLVGEKDSKDFAKGCFKFFRDKADGKGDITAFKPDVDSMMKTLIDGTAHKDLVKLEKTMNDAFKAQIKTIDEAAKSADRDATNYDDTPTNGGIKISKEAYQNRKVLCANVLRKESAAFSKCQNIAGTFVNAWYSAIKERDRAYKGVCLKAMSYKPKKK